MPIHEATHPTLARGPDSLHPALERPTIDVVLACVDVSSTTGSLRGRAVLRAADLVATRVPTVPAALYVVHVGALVGESILACPLRGVAPERFRALAARAEAEWRKRLEALCAEVLGSPPTGALVRRGDARQVVPALCRRLRVDVVVLGRSARSGLGALAMGGLASALSGRVESDVLIVGPPRSEAAPTAPTATPGART